MTCAYALEGDDTKIALHTQPSSSPFMFVPQGDPDNPEAVKIMGFVSVQTEDRDGEIFAPETFNKSQFLSVAGPVFVNHRAWVDPVGNPVSAGKVDSLHVVRVRNSKEDKGFFEVVDVEKRRVIATYPKESAPDMKAGTRGLFAKITVTEPGVVKQVRDGYLRAFSWRGQAVRDTQFDMKRGRTLKTASHIDLWEISLVNVPTNPDASFMVEKGRLIGIIYPENTPENGLDFFVDRARIQKSVIRREASSGKLVVRLREKSPKPDGVVVVKSVFGDELVLDVSKHTGASNMASDSATKSPEELTLDELVDQAVQKSMEAQQPLLDTVNELKTAQVATNEVVTALAKSVEAIANKAAEADAEKKVTDADETAKSTAVAEPETETEEETEDVSAETENPPTDVAELTKSLKETMAEFTKSMESLIPRNTEREEDIQKSKVKADPLSCFDSMFFGPGAIDNE